MVTTHIDELVTKLQAAHAARLGQADLPRTLTAREFDAYLADTARMAATLSALRNIENDLRNPLAQLAECEAKRAATLAKQRELETAIADAPDWRSFADERARNREFDEQEHLRTQLRLLHENRLLYAPGLVFENAADLGQRIAELHEKLETLRANHEALVEAAERLLGEEVSA